MEKLEKTIDFNKALLKDKIIDAIIFAGDIGNTNKQSKLIKKAEGYCFDVSAFKPAPAQVVTPASKEENKHKHHKKHKTKSKKIESTYFFENEEYEYSIVEVISSPKKGNEITLEKIEKIRFKPLKRFFNIRQKEQAVDYNEKRIENSKDKCRLRIMMDAVALCFRTTAESLFYIL